MIVKSLLAPIFNLNKKNAADTPHIFKLWECKINRTLKIEFLGCKKHTWTKTNINTHIKIIKNSPHRNVIKLLKIWSKLNELDFSSFVLEMTVLEALTKKRSPRIDKKFLLVLEYIIEEFEYAKIYDPANTNNVISDSISDEHKNRIIQAAITSLSLALISLG